MTVPFAYRALVPITIPLVPHLLRAPRQRAAHAQRLTAPQRLIAWGTAHRELARPLIWCHATSVGEGMQARAVLSVLRELVPEMQVVYTHFSPSAEAFAETVRADVHDYLPYDRPSDIAPVLAALQPTLLCFAKLDLWPRLATMASAAGTRTALVAGTVRPGSGRLRWPARHFTHAGYAALDLALAIARADADRLIDLGVHPDRVEVTGDPRIDSALAAVAAIERDDPMLQLANPRHTLVAGSTWPADEEVLLEAFALIRASHPDARLIVVPHEPTAEHLARLDAAARHANLPTPERLASPGEHTAPLLVVDRVGVLARCYANGGIAYVGGGFGSRGIHSVIEPAAWRRPVMVGPHDRGSRDIRLLVAGEGLHQLSVHGAVAELARQWGEWLVAPDRARAAGEAAHHALTGERGAAARSAGALARLLRR